MTPDKKPFIKIREHKGGLEESMRTVVEISATRESVTKYIQSRLKPFDFDVTSDMVHVKFHGKDARIGWNTYIIEVDNYGVFGFSDGPLLE